MHFAQQSRTDHSSADSATCARRLPIIVAVFALLAGDLALASDTYYVATNGSDNNSGSVDSPFGTFDHAIRVVTPGDTIYVRGGTYMLDHRLLIDKAGTPDSPINLWAMPGETPILDFSNNPRHANPPQPRENDTAAATSDALGIYVANGGDWWHLKGLTVQNAPYYGVRIYGSHNIFERLVLHDNKASGLEITGKEGRTPSHNLVLNSDSYHNFDPQTNGEDADGFAAKFDTLGPGNVFRGCRAWSNSDDGIDFWNAASPVRVEDCWSFDNGFNRPEWVPYLTGTWRGDGMGFKLGASANQITLNRIVAWGNKAYGVTDAGNGHPDGVIINNATLVNNAKAGNPIQISLYDRMPHTITNTIAFDVDGSGVTRFRGPVNDTFNTWNGIGVSAADFESLDMDVLFTAATTPRGNDGSLPEIGLRLAASSRLIDAGTDVGLPYIGAAPDLGAFEAPERGEYEPNRILVRFHDDVGWEDKMELIDSLGCSLLEDSEYTGCMRIHISAPNSPEEMVAAFEGRAEMVAYAEKEYIVRGFFVPNDPFYTFQWHFADEAGANINIEEAWDLETGDPRVVIAVVDTGVAYEDFGPFVRAPDLANTRFVAGFDFVNDDAHPNDDNGHGTRVTGTIAQSTNNGLGVAGVAFDCSVMPVKSLGANSSGSVFDVADGVVFAALNGADVINMSLGGAGDSMTLRNACQKVYEMGVTLVCAAGNQFNDGNPIIYPAAYDEFCIAVGAVRYDESRANYSNVGGYIDVAAPGGDLAVDQNGDGFGDGVLQQSFSPFDVTDFAYSFFQGTSMAAAHVAGVAGLLHAKGLTDPQKVRLAIEAAAQDLGPPGRDPEYGAGLLNAAGALISGAGKNAI